MRRSAKLRFVVAATCAVLIGLAAPALAVNLAAPKPIPGGVSPTTHIFVPGPTALDVEPSAITDFTGFSALAYVSGTATDGLGTTYKLSTDMRVFQGQYVGQDGITRFGTFAFIWIDLYDLGSGSQVHDFNGGVASTGLFWTVRVPNSALTIGPGGTTATLSATDVQVVDAPPGSSRRATVSFSVTWTAQGTATHYEPGSSDPKDPTNFRGTFFQQATATGSFSGQESGFTFTSSPGASSSFAELGHESNGSFLG